MARGVRLPRTAGRPPRFLRTGHRRATSLSEAHLQAARRDAGHTLGREAEGVLQSLLFHRASRGLRAQRATFRVLAEGDPDVDAALASAVSCSPPPRSLTPPRPPLSDQRGRAARGCGAAQIVRKRWRDRWRRRGCSAACGIPIAWLAPDASRSPWRARGRLARFPRFAGNSDGAAWDAAARSKRTGGSSRRHPAERSSASSAERCCWSSSPALCLDRMAPS